MMRRILLLCAALASTSCALEPVDAPDAGALEEEFDMAGPLFIRTPFIQSAFVYNADSGEPNVSGVLCTATGPTLVERVLFATHESAVALAAGQILLMVNDGTTLRPIKHVRVEAYDQSALGPLSGEIRLDLVLQDGWSLVVAHTIKPTSTGNLVIAFTSQGGELG